MAEKPLAFMIPKVLYVPRSRICALVEQQPGPAPSAKQQYGVLEHWTISAPLAGLPWEAREEAIGLDTEKDLWQSLV